MFNVIDLFSGVGGLSLGAARAGFNVRGAVELDPFARHAHSLNFPNSVHLSDDISTLTGSDLLSKTGLHNEILDGLIGGPPCQGFSAIGRRRSDDKRNSLFFHFFRLVAETKPRFFLAENVPGIMAQQHDQLRRAAFNQLSDQYLILDPIKAVASDYGAPTSRARFFFIGFNRSHFSERVIPKMQDFTASPEIQKVTVKKALQGLPEKIMDTWITEKQGWRKVNFHGMSSDDPFFCRVIGMIPKNIGHKLSIERYLTGNLVSGCLGTRHSSAVAIRYKQLPIGKTDPISRSQKLDPNGFCPTLRAGTGSDRGSFQAVRPIHFSYGRVITPREAARLQGFPDWFKFDATKWHSFRQIGNSVSPIVAELILSVVCSSLDIPVLRAPKVSHCSN